MGIYYFTIVLLMFSSFLETRIDMRSIKKKYSLYIYILPLLYIIFHIGLRWEIATDWGPYLQIFKNSSTYIKENVGIEKGYLFLNYMFYEVSDFQVFIVFHAILTYLISFLFFRKYTIYPALAMMWFYATTLGMVGSNRQFLAIDIGMIAILLYDKTKKLKYFFPLVLCAFLFHTSSILLAVYPFLYRKITNKMVIIILLTSILIGFTNLTGIITSHIGILGQIAENKMEAYSDEGDSGYSVFAILKRIIILVVALYLRKRNKEVFSDVVFNGYLFGVCLYFVFGQSLTILATRGAFYFNIMEPVLITYYLYFIKNTIIKHTYVLAISILCMFLSLISIKQYPEIYVPYKSKVLGL
ncbi:hypothetical protein CMU09_16635 [Elizabethkingia anophelis]|nr:hypothetical protein [Elizabethkingia anophelis]MDV3778863.1 hypothetical protein [Elizabethkingia anophelis]MDV3792154.1 hypothetical protein [Elizabethkingia anophelis]MDV3813673.1 hypothetical protein [Elizabethkingia anophelis]MDV4007412.1 hypothetical protein [Elizabethkingia anophelis]